MKPYIIGVMLFFSFGGVYADSGACSYHGGVDCSAGRDSDGSVICNDGSRDSSVLFSSMTACRSNLSDMCPMPLSMGASSMAICDMYQKNCDTHVTQLRNTYRSAGIEIDVPDSCPQADSCREAVNDYEARKASHDICVKQAFQLKELETRQANAELQQLEKSNADKRCQVDLGINSYSSGTACYCSDGYFIGRYGQCVTDEPVVVTPIKEEKQAPVEKTKPVIPQKKPVVKKEVTPVIVPPVIASVATPTPVILTPKKENKFISFFKRLKFW